MKSKIKTGSAIALVGALAMLAACSDSESKNISGGVTEDKGIVANLDVAGVSQKGPFVKGATVTVQGIDCKTLKFTDEVFEGKVKSDKGDFTVEDVSHKSTCALFEVTGVYRNEITGKESANEITLHALTDLKDRKNVNINVLTELEYERLMFLVTGKGKKFAEAKEQAEKEVLAAFDIKGDFVEFENLNIFESGDENAALLAVSVMMQAETDDAGLVTRMEKFVESFAETGKWKDSTTKNAISEWAIEATANGGLDSIRKNVEAWDLGDTVPAFEKFIEAYADGDSIILSSSSKDPEPAEGSSSSGREASVSSSSQDTTYNAEKNTLTDTRDGQVYRTVTIGDQVWMAENLNYKTDSSFCYNDSAEYCAKYGRLYVWTAAMDACPSGWHLPDLAEWKTLFAAVGGDSVAGAKLKSTSGWNSNGNGTDDFGFTVLPAGGRSSKDFVGEAAAFWTSEWYGEYDDYAYGIRLYTDTIVRPFNSRKYIGSSVRCLKGESPVAGSSSSLAKSSSSYSDGWSWDVPKETRLNPNIKYDSIIDPRDKQVYKIVKIEVPDSNYSQVWMAENLNYADSVKTPSLKGNNWCYQGDEKKCKVSGRYYSWAAAIDSVALANDAEAPLDCGYGKKCGLDRAVQGICPDGWHLPSIYEWGLLSVALGNAPVSGEPLKALTGWNYAGTPDNNGTDLYGFAALPTGRRISATKWEKVGSDVYYWSATEYSANDGRYFNINNVYTNSYTYQNSKSYGQSVRCVKGDPSTAPVRPSSSSSVTSVSSSSAVSSSSSVVAMAKPCKTETEDNCEYGTLTDDRDGQTYKTVKIGKQWWMAENLNYASLQPSDSLDSTSFCYNDSLKYCEKYGRLYTWAAAVDSAGVFSSEGKGCGYYAQCTFTKHIRGVCPDGWHVPDTTEWQTLIAMVSGDYLTAGKLLKATSGWDELDGKESNGTDSFGFAALPVGAKSQDRLGDLVYVSLGSGTRIWAATDWNDDLSEYGNKVNGGLAYYYTFQYDALGHNLDYKLNAYPVRCVKD